MLKTVAPNWLIFPFGNGDLQSFTLIFGGLMLFSSLALAQEAAANAPKPGTLEMFLPFIAMFAIFYFLIIRPQGRKMKAHAELVKGLQKGDEVLTSGGILGTIVGLTDNFITLEIADDVNIRILRSQISNKGNEEQKK